MSRPREGRLFEDVHAPPHPHQDLDGAVELVAGVGGGDDGADAGLSVGDQRSKTSRSRRLSHNEGTRYQPFATRWTFVAELLSQDSVLFTEIIDGLPLLLAQPAGDRNQQESELVQDPAHWHRMAAKTARQDSAFRPWTFSVILVPNLRATVCGDVSGRGKKDVCRCGKRCCACLVSF
jgi:hypothetical protein